MEPFAVEPADQSIGSWPPAAFGICSACRVHLSATFRTIAGVWSHFLPPHSESLGISPCPQHGALWVQSLDD
jgi:hypothetical protein